MQVKPLDSKDMNNAKLFSIECTREELELILAILSEMTEILSEGIED